MAEKQAGGPPPSGQEGPPPAYSNQPQQPGYPPQGAQPAYPGQPMYPPPAGGMPPQQGGYVPQQAATTVVVTQPGYATGPLPGSTVRYRQDPMLIICQHCNATVTTTTTYEIGLLTYAIAGLICLFGCWIGCCLIPFCIDQTKDVTHTCPNCNQLCGKFRQFS